MYLTFFYKPSERATRMAIFSASVAVSGAFGGLIATGVSYMSGKGGLHGWQWLVRTPRASASSEVANTARSQFILEGIPAFIVGIVIYFYLPDFPETAKFLTEEERAFASARMGPFAPKMADKHFDKAAAIACIKEWQFWVFAVTYFCMTNSLNAFGCESPRPLAFRRLLMYRGLWQTSRQRSSRLSDSRVPTPSCLLFRRMSSRSLLSSPTAGTATACESDPGFVASWLSPSASRI